jgi:hypothetical protein
MPQNVLSMSAWRRALAALGADLTGAVLLAAPDGPGLAAAAGAPVRQEGLALVTLGAGDVPTLAEGATPTATGAPDASFDSVLMLAAWGDVEELGAVAAEASRIVRRGCRVWLGDVDAQALASATPATHLQALLYRQHRSIAERLVARHEGSSRMALAALAAGLRPVVLDRADLPLGAFGDAAEYLEAVRGGMWHGWEWVDAETRDGVLGSLQRRLRGGTFPMIANQPWLLVHGLRSR